MGPGCSGRVSSLIPTYPDPGGLRGTQASEHYHTRPCTHVCEHMHVHTRLHTRAWNSYTGHQGGCALHMCSVIPACAHTEAPCRLRWEAGSPSHQLGAFLPGGLEAAWTPAPQRSKQILTPPAQKQRVQGLGKRGGSREDPGMAIRDSVPQPSPHPMHRGAGGPTTGASGAGTQAGQRAWPCQSPHVLGHSPNPPTQGSAASLTSWVVSDATQGHGQEGPTHTPSHKNMVMLTHRADIRCAPAQPVGVQVGVFVCESGRVHEGMRTCA